MNQKQIENFVKHSNAIEGIRKESGILWTNHIQAVKNVLAAADKDFWVLPLATHNTLMAGVMRKEYVGKYRTVGVQVGGDICPNPASVPYLMNEWRNKVSVFTLEIVKNFQLLETNSIHKDAYSKDFLSNKCWHFHHYFETVHPFIDGNGRTGRLILNNLRLLCGLDWITIDADKRWDYYDAIREWKSAHFEDERNG